MPHFRHFHDAASGCFSYLVGCRRSGSAVLVDPVAGQVPLYLGVLGELGLRLAWVLETHLHADRPTGADALRQWSGARIAVGARTGIAGADRLLADGDPLVTGDVAMVALATPGHTRGCLSFAWEDRLFTGDSLLIGGCGRLDEPGGNGPMLFDSVTRRLLCRPDETLVYPGRCLSGRWVSCIGEEREHNPLFHGISRDGFAARWTEVAAPARETAADIVAANRQCGRMARQGHARPRPPCASGS